MKLSAVTALAAILAIPAMAEAPSKYLVVPGTDTAIQVYGRVTFDVVHDFVQPDGVLAGLSAASIKNDDSARDKNQWDMTAACSRFGLRTVTPSAYGDVKTRMEVDFNGTNKDSAGSPNGGEYKNYLHLRQMYGEFAGFLAGKTDSNFMDPDGSPNYIDEDGLLADDYGVGRIGQIRYTAALNNHTTLAVSFEQNSVLNFGNDSPAVAALDARQKAAVHVKTDMPGSLVGRLGYADKWGHVSFSGAFSRYGQFVTVPYVAATTTPAAPAIQGFTEKHTKNTFSWTLSGHFQFGDDSLVWQFGKGNGQYGAGLQDGVVFVGSNLKTIDSTQALAGFEHYWSPKVHSNLFASTVSYAKDAETGMDGNAFHTYNQVGFNTMWSITRTVQLAAEYIYGEAKTFDKDTIQKVDGTMSGDAVHESKLHFQFKYNFN